MTFEFRGAVVAATAGGVPTRSPPHRPGGSAVRREKGFEAGASVPIDRHDLRERVGGDRAVAEDEMRVRGHRRPGARECVRVSGELEQGLDLRVPGEFAVVDGVAVVLEDEEVGEADHAERIGGSVGEAGVEERALIDDGRAGPDGVEGGLRRLGERLRGVLGPGDLDDLLRTHLRAEAVEDALLVAAAECGDTVEHCVGFGVGAREPTERRVEVAEHCELARGGAGEISGAEDQPVVEKKHRQLRLRRAGCPGWARLVPTIADRSDPPDHCSRAHRAHCGGRARPRPRARCAPPARCPTERRPRSARSRSTRPFRARPVPTPRD